MSCINLNDNITLGIPAGDALPLVERYGPSLRWLLGVAAGAIPEERGAIARLRRALDRIAARRGARFDARDLKIALGGVLEAIERDLGAVPTLPKFGTVRSERSSRPEAFSNNLLGNAEWGLALGAGEWMPLFRRYRATVEWLLDVAHDTAKSTGSRQRNAIARVRTALRRLTHPSVLVDLADLGCVATLVLIALERDLGPVGLRPRGRFRMPTPAETFSTGLATLLRTATRRLGKTVAP